MKVEIKETVSGDVADQAEKALAPGAVAVTERRIYFSEVPVGPDAPLVLAARGLVVRSRRGPEGGDVTLKLRGPEGCLDTERWDDRTRDWKGAKLEGDWAGRRHLLSASLDHDLDGSEGDTDPVGATGVVDSLSHDQATLVEEWMIPIGSLETFGPVESRKWSLTVPGTALDCDVEVWELDELRFLEVSARVRIDGAEAAQRDLHDALVRLGLPESAFADTTKTEAVLRRLMR